VSVPARTTVSSPKTFHGWTQEEVDLIRRTVAPPDATDHELALYLRLCHVYGLDPFRKELVMVKRRRRLPDGSYESVPIFITTRDGYLRAAQRDPGYAGIMSAAVHENDHFEFDIQNQQIIHRFGKDRGKLIGAWAVAYHKERPPVMAYVPLSEYYDASSDTWKTHPSAMICKVAEVYVLRRQFNLSGIVAREEIELDLRADETPPAPHSDRALPSPNGEAAAAPRPAQAQAAPPAPEPAPARRERLPSPTEFWRAVRAAAAAAGEDYRTWLAKRTGGQTDMRQIPPDSLRRIYAEALRPAAASTGQARPAARTDTQTGPAPAPDSNPKTGLALLQAEWRRRRLSPEEQAAQVRAITQGRTAIPGEMTADEIASLLDVLAHDAPPGDQHDAAANPDP
jgi:phage recombination protein Bet